MFTADKEYSAKIVDAAVTTTKAGAPQIRLGFHVTDDEGQVAAMDWYGGLSSDKAMAFTVKNLITCGYTGDGSNLAALTSQDFQATTGLTVSLEAHNGSLRIKWINSPATSTKKATPFVGQLPNLAGALAKARQELGIKKPVSFNDL